MFSFVWKKASPKSAVFAALVLVLLAVLAGCDDSVPPPDIVPEKLQGEWFSDYGDGFVIKGNTLSQTWDGETFNLAGTIKYIAELEGTPSGVIVIQYTIAPEHADVGNYTAVYFNGNQDSKILEFGTAVDYTVPPIDMGGWEGQPPVNISDRIRAITLLGSGEYYDNYIRSWYGAEYYHEDYVPAE